MVEDEEATVEARDALDAFIIGLAEAYEASKHPVPGPPPPERPTLPRPRSFRLEQDERHTVIRWGSSLGGPTRTRIEATADTLTVKRGLWPWRRQEWRVERQELVQLYGKAQKNPRGGQDTYRLYALTRQGRRLLVATGFTEQEPVLYLEQVLEKRLGIPDGWVKGELAQRPPPESWDTTQRTRLTMTLRIPVTPDPEPSE